MFKMTEINIAISAPHYVKSVELCEEAIKKCKNYINNAKEKIEKNCNNPNYFRKREIIDMHDNGYSDYELDESDIKYFTTRKEQLEEQINKINTKENEIKEKAKALNITVEEYKENKEKKEKEKAEKRKYKKFLKEIEELKKELKYRTKWIKEYESRI